MRLSATAAGHQSPAPAIPLCPQQPPSPAPKFPIPRHATLHAGDENLKHMSAPALSTLTPVQAQVIHALAQGTTVTAAATAAGIHRSTIHDWLRTQPEFDQAVRAARDEYRLTLRDNLCELSRASLATLRALIEDPQTPAAVRGKLALAVLCQLQLSPDDASLAEAPASPLPAPASRQNPTLSDTSATLRAPGPHLLPVRGPKIGRNAPCPCGSGRKFKYCCLSQPSQPAPPAA
jgi:SEC-C motif/Homeodomain-like domain